MEEEDSFTDLDLDHATYRLRAIVAAKHSEEDKIEELNTFKENLSIEHLSTYNRGLTRSNKHWLEQQYKLIGDPSSFEERQIAAAEREAKKRVDDALHRELYEKAREGRYLYFAGVQFDTANGWGGSELADDIYLPRHVYRKRRRVEAEVNYIGPDGRAQPCAKGRYHPNAEVTIFDPRAPPPAKEPSPADPAIEKAQREERETERREEVSQRARMIHF